MEILIIVSSGGRTEMLEETDADVNIMGAPMFDSDHALQWQTARSSDMNTDIAKTLRGKVRPIQVHVKMDITIIMKAIVIVIVSE